MPPKPLDEEHRLEALYNYQVLDTPPEEAFDRITRIAADRFAVPIALVSLIDRDRQWFKSCVGLTATETPRDAAFCAYAIMRDDVLCIPNALADERFATNPLVIEAPHIRFYAGAPLVTADGFRLGTLCLIDTKPRSPLSASEQSILKDLAALTVDALELRRSHIPTAVRSTASPLLAAKESAERANAAKAEFLAMMSHELRTPLNAIMGFSTMLAEEAFGPIGDIHYKDYANSIQESGAHLLTLIETILDFAKAEQGDLKLCEAEFDICDVVAQAVRLLAAKASNLGVAVTYNEIAQTPGMRGDRRYVLQMLLNTVGNAIKFNRPGGSVSITTLLNGSGGLEIHIVDTGIGISAARIDRLLQPLAQIDGRLARQYEGIGLGVAITRKLVKLHRGAFSLGSQENIGTSVALAFPAERTLAAPHTSVA